MCRIVIRRSNYKLFSVLFSFHRDAQIILLVGCTSAGNPESALCPEANEGADGRVYKDMKSKFCSVSSVLSCRFSPLFNAHLHPTFVLKVGMGRLGFGKSVLFLQVVRT